MSGVIMTIHLFHLSDLEETTRRALEKRLNPLEMPKNCFFVDTEPIPDATLTPIRPVFKEQQIKWPWCRGDVLVLVNLRVSHGRTSFGDTERRILVAMS
jgi:alpha-ketoglutarate-dependent taurine dioxygenase